MKTETRSVTSTIDASLRRPRGIAVVAVALAAEVVGFAIVLIPIAALFFAFLVLVAVRPVTAAYVFLATQPFVGGIDRGVLIPLCARARRSRSCSWPRCSAACSCEPREASA